MKLHQTVYRIKANPARVSAPKIRDDCRPNITAEGKVEDKRRPDTRDTDIVNPIWNAEPESMYYAKSFQR